MHATRLLIALALSSSTAFSQASAPAFDVASVKPSQHQVGPDYNNQLTYTSTGFTARNTTLQRLLADAYHLQLNQVSGPSWIDRNEYDIDAKAADPATPERMAAMLQSLVAARFNVKQHTETRDMRVYELVTDKAGPKIHPIDSGQTPATAPGFHFHGDLRQFADLLALGVPPGPELGRLLQSSRARSRQHFPHSSRRQDRPRRYFRLHRRHPPRAGYGYVRHMAARPSGSAGSQN